MNMDQNELLPPDAPPELRPLMEWFQGNVARLESAYNELGRKFEMVNRELALTNEELLKALREKEQTQKLLGALLDSIDTGVFMVDHRDDVLVFNQAAERLLGLPAESCIGRGIQDCSPAMAELLSAYASRSWSGKPRETILPGTNGTFPASCTAAGVQDQSGDTLGVVVTIVDLTERKRMQAEVQQDRVLRALGEMAATVAHEIRNPLGGIGGYAGLLARGIPAEDPKRKLVDKIIQGVSSLNKIVGNLLVYTRHTQLQRVPVDLVEWFDEVLAHAELEIEREGRPIQVVREFPAEPVRALIDPDRFQQVALNLLFNAIQAIPVKGDIRVTLFKEAGQAVVVIADTGNGIEDADLERIFTPFFTTKEQGTGLGLAIVRKLVELHEGSIVASSRKGEGTAFRIGLPASE